MPNNCVYVDFALKQLSSIQMSSFFDAYGKLSDPVHQSGGICDMYNKMIKYQRQ